MEGIKEEQKTKRSCALKKTLHFKPVFVKCNELLRKNNNIDNRHSLHFKRSEECKFVLNIKFRFSLSINRVILMTNVIF